MTLSMNPYRRCVAFLLLAALVTGAPAVWAKEKERPPTERRAKAAAAPVVEQVPKADRADGADKADKPTFVRITRDDAQEPLAMETAIARFVSADKGKRRVVVDLIAAVHVGEEGYYAALNKRFADYDAVLYELVATEGTRVPKGGAQGGGSTVSALQRGLKNMLGLKFQLEQIDYSPENFIHADMSPDEFSKAMKERGESFWTMFWRMMAHSMAQQGQMQGRMPSDFEVLMALFDKNRSFVLKRMMAEQLSDVEGMTTALEGPNGSALVSGRNQKALDVLRREMGQGKKRIAIFYGAAHMPDIQARLIADFHLKPDKTEWLKAWDLSAPAAKAVDGAKPGAVKPAR